MADNILTKDRADADLDIAAKEIASVKFPRNILTDPSGNDLTPLTDAALRATPVPVSVPGSVAVTGTFWQATQPVSFTWAGLTDAQLRATAVAVSLASVPLPTGAATEATLDARTGSLTETAPASDTASSGLNGRLQRVAQRLTSLIALLPGSLGAKAASASLAVTLATDDVTLARLGTVTETAPASDTASSGLNGRLQRVAQRLTSLIALLPASLGQKAGSASLSVVDALPTVVIVSLQTNATGSTYNAFASQACTMLDIVNTAPAAVDLEVRRGGSGNTITVPAGSSRMFIGIANASDLQVRRLDQSNTQVTFTAEAIAQ
jgi:hypothetical protein